MRAFWHTARLDIAESVRARWFLLYALVFGGLVAVLFVFGLTESRVMGFTGLSRVLLTYIQLTMAIMPIFVLLSTVRSLAGDREAGVYEYMLSFPVALSHWFWGRFTGRFAVVFLPVFAGLALAVPVGLSMGAQELPWRDFFWYSALLVSLAMCFLGLGFFISALARTSDMAQSLAFITWLALLMFLDLVLLGLLVQYQAPPELVVGLALANPLEVFRIGAMMLFDPELILLGPAAWIILDIFGQSGFMLYALAYPLLLGLALAALGYWRFARADLP